MSENTELKPCPFCGSSPQVVTIGILGIAIRCKNPKCRVKPSTDANVRHAAAVAKWWNSRIATCK